MSYYWVKNVETEDNEIIEEFESDGVLIYRRFFDETNYSLEQIKQYYTFICEIKQPNEL